MTATVVVPTLIAGDQLVALVRSLAAQTAPHELIVVDNGGLASLEDLRAAHPNVRLISPGENLGFGRAVNRAAEMAAGDLLLTTNDDCVLEPDYVERLIGALADSPGDAMAAAVLLRVDGTVDSAGVEVDRTLMAFDHLHGSRVSELQAAPVPLGPTGGAAAYRREDFLAAGGYDERLFAYLEDVDLALRLRLRGSGCAFARDARALHAGSATLGSGSPEKNRLMGFARGYLLRKWRVVSARRLIPVIWREALLCAGQAAVDRNLAGLRGRLSGFRAARGAPLATYPAELLGAEAVAGPRFASRLGRRLGNRRAAATRDSPSGAMAILHLAEVSGPSRSLEAELRRLSGEGELSVVIPRNGSTPVSPVESGEPVARDYSALTVPRGAAGPLRALTSIVREFLVLRREIRRRRPGLVIVSSATLPAALLAAGRDRVPTVLYAGEILGREGIGALRRLAGEAAMRLAVRRASAVIACSPAVARGYEERGARCVTTILPPVGDRYESGDGEGFRRRFGIPADVPLAVCVGALSRGRGQDIAVRAIAAAAERVEGLRLAVVGAPHPRAVDTRYADELEREAAGRLGEAVRFTGFLSSPEDAYAAADIVLNPALDEAFGRVAFEALRAGAPVVSSACGAVPELLRDGVDALLVEPGSEEALAEAIVRVLTDQALANALVAAGSARARELLDPEAALAAFEQVTVEARIGC